MHPFDSHGASFYCIMPDRLAPAPRAALVRRSAMAFDTAVQAREQAGARRFPSLASPIASHHD